MIRLVVFLKGASAESFGWDVRKKNYETSGKITSHGDNRCYIHRFNRILSFEAPPGMFNTIIYFFIDNYDNSPN
jgi:hypothetical protein